MSLDDEKIDVLENNIASLDKTLLEILLIDRTSNKNILWCTDNYANRGAAYKSDKEIGIELITGINGNIIKPRTKKSLREKKDRIKTNAEVFTPSWVSNAQNNLIDDAWLGRSGCFNEEIKESWITTKEKIPFDALNRSWQDYIFDTRLEIACGEAPYLVSRYDTVTGKIIEPKQRIGIIDRKIRVICENAADNDWFLWVKKAYQSSYGYEWQGDSLLIARENLLYTFRDHYFARFGEQPSISAQKEIAEIISWNVWQMDGLKGVIPMSCSIKKKYSQTDIFGGFETDIIEKCPGCERGMIHEHNGVYCKIKDWKDSKQKTVKFIDLFSRWTRLL